MHTDKSSDTTTAESGSDLETYFSKTIKSHNIIKKRKRNRNKSVYDSDDTRSSFSETSLDCLDQYSPIIYDMGNNICLDADNISTFDSSECIPNYAMIFSDHFFSNRHLYILITTITFITYQYYNM